jgi:hypothetical protein
VTYRSVRSLVIHVHERPLDIRQSLNLVLELLADIVRLPEWGVAQHDDIDLDEKLRAALYCDTAYQ